jgi:hypothetical protein
MDSYRHWQLGSAIGVVEEVYGSCRLSAGRNLPMLSMRSL